MTKRELPAPFYAAAGAGDLAYQRLRKLPETANRTLRAASETAATLRERAASGELRFNRDRVGADLATLRESAQRGATAFMAKATAAQEKAVTGYRNLVAHGEQVVAVRTGAAQTVEPAAEIEASPAEAAEPPAVEPEQPAAGEPVPPTAAKKAAARARRPSKPAAG